MTLERTLQVVQVTYPQVYLACHTRHQRKRSSAHRVSSRDAAILAHLSPTTAVLPARLAEHLGVARSTLSEALKRLSALGYVERPAAGRGGVRLTMRGAEVVGADSVLETGRLRAALATLTPAELRLVAKGLTALADGCRRARRAPDAHPAAVRGDDGGGDE